MFISSLFMPALLTIIVNIMILKWMQKNCFYENSFDYFINHPNKSKFLKVITADLGVAEVTKGFAVV